MALDSTHTDNAGGFGGDHWVFTERSWSKKNPAEVGVWAAISPVFSENTDMATQGKYAPPLAAT